MPILKGLTAEEPIKSEDVLRMTPNLVLIAFPKGEEMPIIKTAHIMVHFINTARAKSAQFNNSELWWLEKKTNNQKQPKINNNREK